MQKREIYIFDALRTPRGLGRSEGALQEIKPIQLLSNTITALLERNLGIGNYLDDIVVGCMTPVGEQGGNIARASALLSGLPYEVSGMQINRFCSSSLEAVQTAAAKISIGWQDLIIAGGLESMGHESSGRRRTIRTQAGEVTFSCHPIAYGIPHSLQSRGRTAAELHPLINTYSRVPEAETHGQQGPNQS